MPGRSSSTPCPPDPVSAPPPSSSAVAPVEVSAQRLQELAVQAFRVGNRGRLSLCEALRVLSETRLYLDLGFPSLSLYADTFFQLRRAEAFEYVRVAKALLELTELREAFGEGRIGWSALKAITRVASIDNQTPWIDFARRNGVERTLAEARDALRRGRDAPRDSSFGLPNLDQKLVLRFSRSDMEKVRAWIESTCAAVAENTGLDEVSLEQAILFLCEKDVILETSPERSADKNKAASGPSHRAQVVYQHCPDCRRARVGTRDGFVEVESGETGRYDGCVEQIVIDGPTPPKLRRRILAREAGRCGNPRCHHPADHCHHIVLRSRGGKTELANEVAVCTTCHALIHAGLIRVTGDAIDELRWIPVSSDDAIGREVTSARVAADRLPVLQLTARPLQWQAPSGGTGSGCRSGDSSGSRSASAGQESAIADSMLELATLDLDDLAGGLTRLGVPAGRSRQIIVAALESLPRAEITEANVLRRAIASI